MRLRSDIKGQNTPKSRSDLFHHPPQQILHNKRRLPHRHHVFCKRHHAPAQRHTTNRNEHSSTITNCSTRSFAPCTTSTSTFFTLQTSALRSSLSRTVPDTLDLFRHIHVAAQRIHDFACSSMGVLLSHSATAPRP